MNSSLINKSLEKKNIFYSQSAIFKDFTEGDILHSQASIEKARMLLSYEPLVDVNKARRHYGMVYKALRY